MPTQTPPSSPLRPGGSQRRWALVALGAVVVVLALGGAFLLGRGSDEPDQAPATKAAAAPSAVTDVEMRPVADVMLPFSQQHGPRITTDGQAAGYSHSEKGAALAAVQVLARTSATAGSKVFEPVLASQVTGTNLAAMKLATSDQYQRERARTPVADGEPIPGNDALVIGYIVTAYAEANATIDVYLRSATDTNRQLISFQVQLVWQGDDWRVVAPMNGDWSTTSTVMTDQFNEPAGLQRYQT